MGEQDPNPDLDKYSAVSHEGIEDSLVESSGKTLCTGNTERVGEVWGCSACCEGGTSSSLSLSLIPYPLSPIPYPHPLSPIPYPLSLSLSLPSLSLPFSFDFFSFPPSKCFSVPSLVPWHVRVQARENDARMPLYKGRTAMKFKNEGTKFRKDGLKSRKDGK